MKKVPPRPEKRRCGVQKRKDEIKEKNSQLTIEGKKEKDKDQGLVQKRRGKRGG